MTNDQYRALGAYIFAGGFTLGVSKHFKVLAHFEDGEFGVETSKANFPDLPIFTDPAQWPVDAYAGQVDFVYGNPPCAPWSISASVPQRNRTWEQKDKYKNDSNTMCVYRMFGLLPAIRPRVWAWESVQRAFVAGRPVVDELTRKALANGYSASYVLFNNADVGAPQNRRRFFCVFHDVSIDWRYPKTPWPTVRQVIGHLPPPDPADMHRATQIHLDAWQHARPGEVLIRAWERVTPKPWPKNARGHVKGRPGFSQRRLAWDETAPVHIGNAHLYHPDEPRLLSLTEAKLLGGYPADYQLRTSSLGRYRELFKAVLPPVGEWLAENVKRAVAEGRREHGKIHIVDLEGKGYGQGKGADAEMEAASAYAMPDLFDGEGLD